jgi:hypothetical protein
MLVRQDGKQLSYVGLKPNGNNHREIIVHRSTRFPGALIATSAHDREIRKYIENQDQGGYGQFPPSESKQLPEQFKAFLTTAVSQLQTKTKEEIRRLQTMVPEKLKSYVSLSGTTFTLGAVFPFIENGVQKCTAINAALGDTRYFIIGIPNSDINKKILVFPVYEHTGNLGDPREQRRVDARYKELADKKLLPPNFPEKGYGQADDGSMRLYNRTNNPKYPLGFYPGLSVVSSIGDIDTPCLILEPEITTLTFSCMPGYTYQQVAITDGGFDEWKGHFTDAQKLEILLNEIKKDIIGKEKAKVQEIIVVSILEKAIARNSSDDGTIVMFEIDLKINAWITNDDGHGLFGHLISRFVHDVTIEMIAHEFPDKEKQAKQRAIDFLIRFLRLKDSQQDALLKMATEYDELNNKTPLCEDDDLPSFNGDEEKKQNSPPSLVLATPQGVQTPRAIKKENANDSSQQTPPLTPATPTEARVQTRSASKKAAGSVNPNAAFPGFRIFSVPRTPEVNKGIRKTPPTAQADEPPLAPPPWKRARMEKSKT